MKKSDLELLQAVKKQEAELRKVGQKQEPAVSDVVNFDAWWSEMAKVKKLAIHIKEIVWADFKSRGLKRCDSKAAFEAALKAFGY